MQVPHQVLGLNRTLYACAHHWPKEKLSQTQRTKAMTGGWGERTPAAADKSKKPSKCIDAKGWAMRIPDMV